MHDEDHVDVPEGRRRFEDDKSATISPHLGHREPTRNSPTINDPYGDLERHLRASKFNIGLVTIEFHIRIAPISRRPWRT